MEAYRSSLLWPVSSLLWPVSDRATPGFQYIRSGRSPTEPYRGSNTYALAGLRPSHYRRCDMEAYRSSLLWPVSDRATPGFQYIRSGRSPTEPLPEM